MSCHANIDALKTELAKNGWNKAETSLEWAKQSWIVVFDTSAWLELYADGSRSRDVPVPSEDRASWTVRHIEGVLSLKQRLASAS